MFIDHSHAKGTICARLYDEKGALSAEHRISNMMVQLGRNLVASRMAGNDVSAISHVGVGTGSTAPALADQALKAQVARVPVQVLRAEANVLKVSATFAPGVGAGPLMEVGLFNAASGNTLTNRALFEGVVTKGARDTLTIDWEIEFL